MKYCVNCGKQIDDNANACGFCGALQGAPQPQAAPYAGQTYAPRKAVSRSLNIGGIVAIGGFVLLLIGLFIPLRGISGYFIEDFIDEYGYYGVSSSASFFTANLAIGIISLILIIAGLAVAVIDTFVKPLGIVAPIAEGVVAVWTFVAMFIARGAVPAKIIRGAVEAEYGIANYFGNVPLDVTTRVEREIDEVLSQPYMSLMFSSKFGFWLLLIGVIVVIAGIVLYFVLGPKKKKVAPQAAAYPQQY